MLCLSCHCQAAALAPLSDLFRFTCIANTGGVPVLQPHPLDIAATSLPTSTTNTTHAVPLPPRHQHSDTFQAAKDTVPACFTKHAMTGTELQSLVLIGSGSAVLTASVAGDHSARPQQVCAGEWLNASTMCRGVEPDASAALTPSARHAACGVYWLPEAMIERFADALPRGRHRLRVWKAGTSGAAAAASAGN